MKVLTEGHKYQLSGFENIDLPNYDIIGRLSSELNKKLEDYIIEGLKRKGFEFENRLELETFIKNNCRCEDTPHKKERVYFANDTPFFLHKYEIEMTNPITLDGDVKMCSNYGSYAYP